MYYNNSFDFSETEPLQLSLPTRNLRPGFEISSTLCEL